jgi:hypothetical protein
VDATKIPAASAIRKRCYYKPVHLTSKNIEKVNEAISEQFDINEDERDDRIRIPQYKDRSELIVFWIEDKKGTDFNDYVAEMLRAADTPVNTTPKPRVAVWAKVYSYESGRDRELSLEFNGFFGRTKKARPDPRPDNAGVDLVGGVFKAFGAIMWDGLASIFAPSITAAIKDNIVDEIQSLSNICEIGKSCPLKNTKTIYINTVGTNIVAERQGLTLQFTPVWEASNPTQVKLEGFNMQFGQGGGLTEIENSDGSTSTVTESPHQIVWAEGNSNRWIYVNAINFLGAAVSQSDVRSKKILGKSSDQNFSKLMIAIEAQVLDESTVLPKRANLESNPEPLPDLTEDALRAMLPLRFVDVVNSLRLSCENDIFQIDTSRKICGFSFEKMGRKYANKNLQIRVDPVDPASGASVLFPTRSQIVQIPAANMMTGRGAYVVPILRGSMLGRGPSAPEGAALFVMTITLADQQFANNNPNARMDDSAPPVVGAQIFFTYNPTSAVPVEFLPQFDQFPIEMYPEGGRNFRWLRPGDPGLQVVRMEPQSPEVTDQSQGKPQQQPQQQPQAKHKPKPVYKRPGQPQNGDASNDSPPPVVR